MRAKTFGALRRLVHAQCLASLARRMKRGPLRATARDIELGSYAEDLEPQIADAVLEMNRKGYCTWSSGFYGKNSDIQGIDGPFTLDATTVARLKELGVKVVIEKFFGRNYTDITFHPKVPDTRRIKREWAKVISRIPAKGYPAILSDTLGAAIFAGQSPSVLRKAKILRLERLIGAKRNARWMRRWRRQLYRLRTAR